MKFKLYKGPEIPDVTDYIKTYISEHPDVEIYVGTDSAKGGKKDGKKGEKVTTVYITTICFRKPYKGAHYIYSKSTEYRDKDLFTKLWKEVERTYKIAQLVKPIIGDRILFLDLDINSLKQHGSNVAYAAATGFLIGQGYSVRAKPQSYGAHAADWLL